MMSFIFASGDFGKPLFVFKGKRIPYQKVKNSNGNELVEYLADCLPRTSNITIRNDAASADKAGTTWVLPWARQFVESIEDLTTGRRKVLLIYDAHHSHMNFQVLQVLDEGGVIAFALPAHTSETMPLDFGVFDPWKAHIDKLLRTMCSPGSDNVFKFSTFAR